MYFRLAGARLTLNVLSPQRFLTITLTGSDASLDFSQLIVADRRPMHHSGLRFAC